MSRLRVVVTDKREDLQISSAVNVLKFSPFEETLDLKCLERFTSLSELDLSYSTFTSITNLNLLTSLRQLRLFNNGFLTHFPNIKQLSYLQVLNLWNCVNMKAPIIDFIPSENLLNLSLIGVRSISFLPDNFGSRFFRLVRLDLDKLKLTHIPSSFRLLTNLQILHLSDNNLTSIDNLPENLYELSLDRNYNLKDVSRLRIMHHTLTKLCFTNTYHTLPLSAITIVGPTRISVRSKPLSTIPIDIRFLTNLQELIISENPIVHLPEFIFTTTTKLNRLEARFCRISSIINIDFSRMIYLYHLDLSNNEIKELPDSFCELPNLLRLNLSSNEISSLPASFSKLTSLNHLSICDNRITAFDHTLFNNMHNLRVLYCTGNKDLHTLPFSLTRIRVRDLIYETFDDADPDPSIMETKYILFPTLKEITSRYVLNNL